MFSWRRSLIVAQAATALISAFLSLGGCGSQADSTTSTLTTTSSQLATTTPSWASVRLFKVDDASNAIYTVALSNDSRWLATGCFDSKVRLYSLTDGSAPTLVRSFHDTSLSITSVSISGDSEWLASGSKDGLARLYSLDSNSAEAEYSVSDATQQLWSVDLSPDARWLATGSADKVARIYAVNKQGRPKLLWSLNGTEDATDMVFTVEFSPDLKWFATGSKDHKVRIYSFTPDWIAPGLCRLVLTTVLSEAEDIVYAVAFSPDSKSLATGSFDTLVRIYQINHSTSGEACAQLLYSLHEATDKIVSVAFSADSQWLAVACNDGSLRIYAMGDVGYPRVAHKVPYEGNYLQSVAFSGNSEWLATGGDDSVVRVYNKHSGFSWESLLQSTTERQVSI